MPARGGRGTRALNRPLERRARGTRDTLNQRTAPPRVSITANAQPADLDRLATPRHAAELVRNQAADGVELVLGQLHAEDLVDRGDVGVAGHALRAVGQRVDAASSSWSSNSSSISPTISSSTSSIVISPAVLPNSSITIAKWLRLERKSRSSSFRRFDSGTNTAGRSSVRRLSSGARCSLSRSLAIRMPMMLSRWPSYTGKREWPVSITTASNSSYGASMSSRSMRGAATITSPAIMSAMRITPSSMMRDSGAISSRCSASASVSISSARVSGPGERNSTSALEQATLVAAGARVEPRRAALLGV